MARWRPTAFLATTLLLAAPYAAAEQRHDDDQPGPHNVLASPDPSEVEAAMSTALTRLAQMAAEGAARGAAGKPQRQLQEDGAPQLVGEEEDDSLQQQPFHALPNRMPLPHELQRQEARRRKRARKQQLQQEEQQQGEQQQGEQQQHAPWEPQLLQPEEEEGGPFQALPDDQPLPHQLSRQLTPLVPQHRRKRVRLQLPGDQQQQQRRR